MMLKSTPTSIHQRRVSGHVTKLDVQDYQYVQAGELLLEMTHDYQVAYRSSQSRLRRRAGRSGRGRRQCPHHFREH